VTKPLRISAIIGCAFLLCGLLAWQFLFARPAQSCAQELLSEEFPNSGPFTAIKASGASMTSFQRWLIPFYSERYYIAFSGPDPGRLSQVPGTSENNVLKGFAESGGDNRISTCNVFTLQTAKEELMKVFPEEQEAISKIETGSAQALSCSPPGRPVEKVLLSDPIHHRHYFVYCEDSTFCPGG
jgi:hypothetical protein